GVVPLSPVGEPTTARSAGTAGSTYAHDRGADPRDRARGGKVSRGAAVDDTPRSGCAHCTGLRADHGKSRSVSVWQADRVLLGAGAVGRFKRGSATARPYHQTRELTVTFLAGGSSTGQRAQHPGMAQ